MSARHAQLVWDGADGCWFIENNASRNGTYVNETRVMRSGWAMHSCVLSWLSRSGRWGGLFPIPL